MLLQTGACSSVRYRSAEAFHGCLPDALLQCTPRVMDQRLLQAREGVQGERVEEHLSQLAALAESSLAGALQCTHGPAT